MLSFGSIFPQVAQWVKNPPVNAGDTRDVGLIPGSGRSPRGGHDNPLQYSAWRIPWTEEPGSAVHRITESDMTEATEHARVLHLHFTSNHQQPISEPVVHGFLALPPHNGVLF